MSVGVVLPNAKVQLFDDNGDPLAGGLLYSYAAGSSTPQNTYSDVGLTTPNANPVVLDAAGRATVYLTPASSYRFLLKDAFAATVWDQDNITVAAVADTVRQIIAGSNITISYTGVDAGTGDVTVNVAASLGGVYTGGVALAGQAIGDLMYASSTVQWAALADVAAGSVLVSGGVGVAPAWSKYPTIAAGTITTSNPVTITQTWNDGAVTFNAFLISVTATASAAASLLVDLKVGGTSVCSVSKAGALSISGDFAIATNKFTVASATGNTVVAGTLGVTGAASLNATTNYVGAAGVARLQFSGSTTSNVINTGSSGGSLLVSHWNGATDVTSATFNATTTTLAGVLTVSGFGTHTFSAGGTGGNVFKLVNTTSGTGNYSQIWLGTNEADYVGTLGAFSSAYTTSGPSVASGVKLSADYAGGLSIAATHASGAIRYYSGGTTLRAQINTNGTQTWAPYGAGTATFDASGNITSVSDGRFKDRVADLPYGLSEVMALRPVQHGYNELSGLEREHLYGGFLAQDVQAVIPLAVGTDQRGYLTLSDRPILGATVNAIKTLNGRIVELEAQVAALRARIH